MTKEEFLTLAESHWESISKLQKEESFYEYEKKFEKEWINYGRDAFEKSISEVGTNRKGKKNWKADSGQ